MAAAITITPVDNGPNIVKGPIELIDAEGNTWPLEQQTVALCRCGHSSNKPFCDGTHVKIGFESTPRAPVAS